MGRRLRHRDVLGLRGLDPEIVAEVARIHPNVRAKIEGPFGRE
jgi:hypothetical protein